ncbi:Chitinase [Saliniradius amylolyticus]|uniref:chitinase n=1 Tax=Saliniradius amylolyticus TaxID=2183582 RepID=A0A2S2E7B9_9ALTE|nr:glycosyl hydrolase family 18 protein [Saliniradius amylolyticus]AWL12857.1 Chitinase [Saliniradius amylolyticus]
MKKSLNYLPLLPMLGLSASAFAAAPGPASIDWMESNYAIIEIDETASSYSNLITIKDYAEIPVSWSKYSGDTATSAKYLLNGTLIKEQALSSSGASQTGSVILQVDTGGQYELDVHLCNADGCTPASETKPVKVEDTDGSHMDPLVLNDGENNRPYDNKSDSVVGAYFVEWGVYGRKFPVDKVPAYNLTHILYGFIPICGPNDSLKTANSSGHNALLNSCQGQEDFTVTLHDIYAAVNKTESGQTFGDSYKGNFGQLMALKQAYPDLKIVPSIGGWTLSDPFYYFGDDAKRATFIASVKEFLKTWKFFDGVDIDWEFPGGGGANPNLGNRSTDGQTYHLLMQELRQMLDELELETGREYELTSAIGVGRSKLEVVDYGAVQQYMDYIFMMSYDFYGAWDTNKLGHQTGLYAPDFRPGDQQTQDFTVHGATQQLLAQGVSPSKLVVGAAMYGRGWSGVSGYDSTSHMTGQGTGAVEGTWEAGVVDYREIASHIASGSWDYYYDSTAQAPYIFNPTSGDLITYDNPRSVIAKGGYVQSQGLAGLFAWEIDADNGDILNAMHEGLGHGEGNNNRTPVANAGLDQTVTTPATIILDGSASSDPDGDALSYSWTQTAGSAVSLSDTAAASPSFDAAEVSATETLSFELTVSDGALSASDVVSVTLEPAQSSNTAPVANAGSDQQATSGDSVILSAASSSDADGDSLSYQWQQTGGTLVSLAGAAQAEAQFTAPTVSANETLTFMVTVSDGDKSDTDSVIVTVAPSGSNSAPVIEIASTASMAEKQSITLTANVSDADGDAVSVSWSVPSALSTSGINSDSVTITASEVSADTDYQLTVTADDGIDTTSATVMLTVTNTADGNTCDATDPNAANYPAWDAGTVYNAPDRVSYDNLVWEAQWWTQGNTPANDGGVWSLISDVEFPWNATTAYNGGDTVNHNDRRYEAKWWTQGEEPGVSNSWLDIGAASCQ